MPAPTISNLTGIFLLGVGESLNYTPFASESPTSWACSGLPSGISINTTTGVISGAPVAAGISTCSLTATNGTGTSLALAFIINVVAAPLADEGLVEINYDIQTGQITNPSISSGPQLYAKNGDVIPIALALVRAGIMRTASITNVKATLRDDYDSEIATLYDDAPGAPLDVTSPRYRLLLDFTAAPVLNALSEHEGDAPPTGTPFELAAKIEIEITWSITAINAITTAIRTTVTFSCHLAKALDS